MIASVPPAQRPQQQKLQHVQPDQQGLTFPHFTRRLIKLLGLLDERDTVNWGGTDVPEGVLQAILSGAASGREDGKQMSGEEVRHSQRQDILTGTQHQDEDAVTQRWQERDEDDGSLPVQTFRASRTPSKRRRVDAQPSMSKHLSTSEMQRPSMVEEELHHQIPDDGPFSTFTLVYPRPDYLIAVQARPRWALLAPEEIGKEAQQPKEIDREKGSLEISIGIDGCNDPAHSKDSVELDMHGQDARPEHLGSLIPSTSPLLHTRASLQESGGEGGPPATAPAALSNLLTGASEEPYMKFRQSDSINSPSAHPTHVPINPIVAEARASPQRAAIRPAARLKDVTNSERETMAEKEYHPIRPPFEQEADLTEASMSFERSAEQPDLAGDTRDKRATRLERRTRSTSAIDTAGGRPKTRKMTSKAMPISRFPGIRSNTEPVTPAPLPVLAAHAVAFADMTAITTPGDDEDEADVSMTSPHLEAKRLRKDRARSPTRKRSANLKPGLRLLPAGPGSVADHLQATRVGREKPLKSLADSNEIPTEQPADNLLPLHKRAVTSPDREERNGATALSQTQSLSATDDESHDDENNDEEGDHVELRRSKSNPKTFNVEQGKVMKEGATIRGRFTEVALSSHREYAHKGLSAALDQEKSEALQRRTNSALEKMSRLHGQEKRIGRRKSLARSRSAQETGGEGGKRLEMSNIPPSKAGRDVILPAATTADLQGCSTVLRPPSSAPPRPSVPRSTVEQDASTGRQTSAATTILTTRTTSKGRPKAIPQRKPTWTSLEACVASWNEWIQEGRLPLAHPGPTTAAHHPGVTPFSSDLPSSPLPPSAAPLLFQGLTFLLVHKRYHVALATTVELLIRRGGRALVASSALLDSARRRNLTRSGSRSGSGSGENDYVLNEEGVEEDPHALLGKVTHVLALGLPRSPSRGECVSLLGLDERGDLSRQMTSLLCKDRRHSEGEGENGQDKTREIKFVSGEWLAECQRVGRLVDVD